MEILDGNATAASIKQEIKNEVAQWVAQGKRRPHLAAILVGDDGASLTYVSSKVKSCEEVGFQSTLIQKSSEITQYEMIALIDELNSDETLDGYIVQLPLPKHLDEQAIMLRIHPAKDVDGFHPENVGRMALNMPRFL
ncbi:MAG: tetrahydrofolate dehydrogenase/cyclohydrolase catalytic domain-containing protein, partial [Flavobacteriales bacterium]